MKEYKKRKFERCCDNCKHRPKCDLQFKVHLCDDFAFDALCKSL